ncbi:SDR family NAD(P)-dependent oxidoreductase [bacterium]|nr:MAG: SDR family NAD(P)-dependent oxidoreductase [bacterium]
MNNLKGKVAVVTGASRGVGKGVALGLAEHGATVYITGRTEKDDMLPDYLKGATIYHYSAEDSHF